MFLVGNKHHPRSLDYRNSSMLDGNMGPWFLTLNPVQKSGSEFKSSFIFDGFYLLVNQNYKV